MLVILRDRLLQLLNFQPTVMILSQLLDLVEELSSSVVYCLHLTVLFGDLLFKEKLRLLVLHFILNDFG